MKPTDDLRVRGYRQLIEPAQLKTELALSQAAHDTVLSGRSAIDRILRREVLQQMLILLLVLDFR